MCAQYEFTKVPGGYLIKSFRQGRPMETRFVEELPEVFDEKRVKPSFIVFPKYQAPVIRQVGGDLAIEAMQWGYLPPWSPRPVFNSQAEKVATSGMWKPSFLKRRCLVPASAFIEWQAVPGARRKTKLRIRPADQDGFCFAGIWQEFRGEAGSRVNCYSIITTTSNEFMRPIHHRMPVILVPDDHPKWLDESNPTGDGLLDLLKPYAGPMAAETASTDS